MKTIFSFLLILLCISGYSQKSKKPAKNAGKVTVLAKAENLTAALIDHKGSHAFYLLNSKAGKTDSLLIKAIVNKSASDLPAEGKIMPFSAKGNKLYLVTWKEKSTTGDAKSRLEITTETHSQIWDLDLKASVFSNVQKVINISEIVFLDPNKNASKTVEKVRRDGFELTLEPVGDIILKNKTQQDKLAYDAASRKYVAVKSALAAPKKK
ncbi:MAG TPA: hypothetical protein VGB43_00020 [Flavobacterium sp.]|jgi:hypothetical protein